MMRVLALLLAGILATVPVGARAGEALVFAAASLGGTLDKVVAAWTVATGNTATISYAASSALAKQIEAGAPADVFISASAEWMDHVETKGLIAPGSRLDLLGNSLVLIAHGNDAAPVTLGPGSDFAARLGDGKLAMALVDSVPAGIYGKAALRSLSLWDEISAKVAQTDNVRAALALVVQGEAPFGIVYATDAKASGAATVVATFPADSHPPIIYPVAGLEDAPDAATAADFLRFLSGPTAAAIFAADGFTPLVP